MPNKLRSLKQKHIPVRKVAVAGGVLILMISNVITMWVSVHALAVAGSQTNSQVLGQTAADPNASVQDRVKQILDVPESEKPTIATIVDLAAVQKQNPTFYTNAKSGDAVLIYSTKAVIYRPDTGKIVNIAPVSKAN